MLSVAPEGEQAGVTSLSGNLSRSKEEVKTFSTDSDHLQNLGTMIEAMENTLRSDMDGKKKLGLKYTDLFCAARVNVSRVNR